MAKRIIDINNWFLDCLTYHNLSCRIPCTLYSVLRDNGIIEDPYYGLNENKLTQLSERGCEFHTAFNVTPQQLECKYILLRFHGIDTLCDVRLNGVLLGNTDNMHRTYEYKVKGLLTAGENKLSLKFSSPTQYVSKMQKKYPLYVTPETIPGAAHLRKASYMFGWDWAPKLPDMGIFRKIELICYNTASLENVFITQTHEYGNVRLNLTAEIDGDAKDTHCIAEFDGSIYEFNGQTCSINVQKPHLWWPNGLGEPFLYKLTLKLYRGDELIDTLEKRIGLRTLCVSTEKDCYGREFCFVINGHKIFSMGANYLPQDSMLADKRGTKHLIESCRNANFNTLRVWGGGVYPDDEFYDLCDENGIIVWQDFMFACFFSVLSDKMAESIKCEAIDNLRRIRHHACIGLLCGNNEIEYGLMNWNTNFSRLTELDYLNLFEHILPDVCDKYAPQIFYWPSSPSSGGGFDNPGDESRGDVHHWDIWHAYHPACEFLDKHFRFCSEFGFSSIPSIKTVHSFANEKDIYAFSEVIDSHQKCSYGYGRILFYCAEMYPYASDFNSLIYETQVMQADMIKLAVEHFRRNRGRCMGSLYWQLNDCWPVVSHSSVDYFGRWKALHYAAKKFYAPVLLSIYLKNEQFCVNISNETLTDFCGSIKVAVKDNSLNTLFYAEYDAKVSALSAADALSTDLSVYITGHQNDRFVCVKLCDDDGKCIAEKSMIFTKPKYYSYCNPEIIYSIEKKGDYTVIRLKASKYAKSVCVDFSGHDFVLSDNFFDITSEEPVEIFVNTDADSQTLYKEISIISMYDLTSMGLGVPSQKKQTEIISKQLNES